jgi:hypothetical protein
VMEICNGRKGQTDIALHLILWAGAANCNSRARF